MQAKDKNVWSARITQSLRAIVHHDGDLWTVLYAGQHDDAYEWAAVRRVERHVTTGALQIVESPEVIEKLAEEDRQATKARGLFDEHDDAYLLSLGVPDSWLPAVRKIASEDILLEAVAKLPEEVADRLLDLAAGKFVTPPAPLPASTPAIESPDSKRRFFVLEGGDDLRRLLEAPLATWIAFLHPSQRKLATGSFSGPVKVTGSAGTGKTVVALHRARHLAAQGKRVLLTTFVTTLCENLERNLDLLCTSEERSRIAVSNIHKVALDLAKGAHPTLHPIDGGKLGELFEKYAGITGCPFDASLLSAEWDYVIRPQGIASWEQYRTASRAGRGTPLSARERKQVWAVFERVLETMAATGGVDWAGICQMARTRLLAGEAQSQYEAVVVDEVQDLGPQELQLLAALAGNRPDSLMLVGDGGQRIYGRRLSLKALGINVVGRSHVLKINYRTTEQIRGFADRIGGAESDNLDGGRDSRKGTQSLFSGPEPILQGCKDADDQAAFVAAQIEKVTAQGISVDEIAIFTPRSTLVDPLAKAIKSVGIPVRLLKDKPSKGPAAVSIGTMHRAKGLEFKVVFVADASESLLPASRSLGLKDPQLREEALGRDRNLLYVSVTRARDEVFISWVGAPSPFLANTRFAGVGVSK